MAKEEGIRMTGTITECLPGAMFRVKLNNENEQIILGHISGKMRQAEIKVLLGDDVEIEFSPYDLSKGRIVRRN